MKVELIQSASSSRVHRTFSLLAKLGELSVFDLVRITRVYPAVSPAAPMLSHVFLDKLWTNDGMLHRHWANRWRDEESAGARPPWDSVCRWKFY